jgi:chaperonin GroES
MAKSTKKFKPISDMVVVKRIEVSNKTEGGIELPDAAKGKSTEGFVIAVGPGRMLDSGVRCKPQVKEDDRVIFGVYSGSETKIDGVEYTLLREDDIFSIVESEDAEVPA